MIGAVVIKAKYISEAKEKYGKEMVDKIFTLMKGQHPDTILWELENEEKECFLLLLKNRYQKDETKN